MVEQQEIHLHTRMLVGKIYAKSHLSTHPFQRVKIVFFEMPCWKCQKMSTVYDVQGEYMSMCGVEMSVEDAMWSTEKFCFRPEIVQAVQKYLLTPEAKNMRVGTIKPRYSKTARKSYVSFGCAFCDAIFGDWYVYEAAIDTLSNERGQEVELMVKVHEPIRYEHPHWCYSEEKVFCQ